MRLGVTTGVATVEHKGDNQALVHHGLEELGQLQVADVASLGVTDIERDEALVEAFLTLQFSEDRTRAGAVARVVDENLVSGFRMLRQCPDSGDDSLVRRLILGS